MKILVTGGLGYIGQVTVQLLEDSGHEVISVDHNRYDVQPSFTSKSYSDSLRSSNYSLANTSILEIVNPDVVIHLAGIVGEPASLRNPKETFYYNYEVTNDLILSCKQLNKRLIIASSCSIYGNQEGLLTEDSEVMPIGLYALTKKLNEEEIIRELNDYCILRFGTVYGSAPRQRFDLVINKFTAMATLGQTLQVYGGKQERPFTNVTDIARALVWSVDHNLQGIYNVADKNLTMKQAAYEIVDIVGGDYEVVDTKEDNRSYEVSSEKLINTGFNFNSKFNSEIQKLSFWVTENDWTDSKWYNSK